MFFSPPVFTSGFAGLRGVSGTFPFWRSTTTPLESFVHPAPISWRTQLPLSLRIIIAALAHIALKLQALIGLDRRSVNHIGSSIGNCTLIHIARTSVLLFCRMAVLSCQFKWYASCLERVGADLKVKLLFIDALIMMKRIFSEARQRTWFSTATELKPWDITRW